MNKNKFSIVVLDDNEFYNGILTERIRSYTNILSFAYGKDYQFDLRSYTSAAECIKNLKRDTDIFFIDFFLDNKINASDLFLKIKNKCSHCKVVVISNTKSVGTILQLVAEDTITFIHKDGDALSKSCMIVDEIVSSRN